MKHQSNFTLLEYKSIYYTNNNLYKEDENRNLEVPKDTFTSIKNFVLKNSQTTQFLKPSYKSSLGEVLTAQNYVGLIQTKDGATIEILPKIAKINSDDEVKQILLKMLKSLRKSPFKNIDFAHLKSCKLPLLEIFISMFLSELSKLVKKGIKSNYTTKEENSNFLKGKLKIDEQLKKNFVHKERFFVQFDEFSSNIAENRVIKTALEFLYKKSKSNENLQKIREFLFIFDDIKASKNIEQDFLKISLNKTTKSYEQTILWCKIFLLKNSFSTYKGDDLAFALLYDMNLLFESYVGAYLKKEYPKHNISLQHRGIYLVEEPKKFALKPDIVINGGKIIADTKWKEIKEEGDISQSDMYQLYAYGTKYVMCKKLYLIYPFCEDNISKLCYKFQKGLNLKVLFFDLKKDKLCF